MENAPAVSRNLRRLGGLFIRRECWTLHPRVKWGGIATLVVLIVLVFWNVHPFLAVTKRVPSDTLIIEGWSPPVTMKQAAAEFASGKYARAILLRPILDQGDQYESGRYTGDFMSNLLVEQGVPKDKLTTLFPYVARKDRTYTSALDTKKWLAEHGVAVKSVDLASTGPHARRSRLLFEKAFGSDVPVGIIAMEDPEYDPEKWWRTSEGFRTTIGEAIAYVYARVFFRAPANGN